MVRDAIVFGFNQGEPLEYLRHFYQGTVFCLMFHVLRNLEKIGTSGFCDTLTLYTVSKANLDLGKSMLLLENPQFLPNQNETLSK